MVWVIFWWKLLRVLRGCLRYEDWLLHWTCGSCCVCMKEETSISTSVVDILQVIKSHFRKFLHLTCPISECGEMKTYQASSSLGRLMLWSILKVTLRSLLKFRFCFIKGVKFWFCRYRYFPFLILWFYLYLNLLLGSQICLMPFRNIVRLPLLDVNFHMWSCLWCKGWPWFISRLEVPVWVC